MKIVIIKLPINEQPSAKYIHMIFLYMKERILTVGNVVDVESCAVMNTEDIHTTFDGVDDESDGDEDSEDLVHRSVAVLHEVATVGARVYQQEETVEQPRNTERSK